jgi:hypothetical protein
MYDFWYALGVAAIKPRLLDAIAKEVKFDFVTRKIIETDQSGHKTVLPKGPNTGLLEYAATTSVRRTMARFVKKFSPSAPPIGIYCAGRFCQLMRICHFASQHPNDSKFTDIIKLANKAYIKALDGGPKSAMPTFPAFLGLCLMDGNFVFDFKRPTKKLKEAVSEFGIRVGNASREWQIATAFVKTAEFQTATQYLMAGDSNPWQAHITLEQIYFWPTFSEHAIP